jgi:hypothetical protein
VIFKVGIKFESMKLLTEKAYPFTQKGGLKTAKRAALPFAIAALS